MNLYTIPLSRSVKQILIMIADALMIVLALVFSFVLLGKDFFDQDQRFYFYLSLATTFSILVFIRIGLYRALVLYMGLQSGFLILQGVTAASCLLAAIDLANLLDDCLVANRRHQIFCQSFVAKPHSKLQTQRARNYLRRW